MTAPRGPAAALLLAGAAACAQPAPVPPTPPGAPDLAALARQVDAVERAFAKTMADRDHAGFVSHLAEHTVFWGPGGLQQGKAAVAAAWKRFYDGPTAPFSWEPDQVVVLGDGTLAHSSGPVRDPAGTLISRFVSVWRQEAPGQWKIVFDRGEALPRPAAPAAAPATSAPKP